MLGELSSSLSGLDEETRMTLANLLDKRNEHNRAVIHLNQLRIEMLMNPTKENEERVDDFSSAVIAPLRDGMSKDTETLLKAAINVDGLKELVPMILMGALQSFNLPLLMATLDVDPDMVKQVVNRLSTFIKDGMADNS